MAKTISCCFITAGELSLANAIKSIRPHVDEVVLVCSPRMGDPSPLLDEKCADLVEVFEEDPEHGLLDFAAARQRSFDIASGDACMWLDSDDVVQNGEKLRELVETAPRGPGLIVLPYDYEHDPDGRVTCTQWRERVAISPGAFVWRYPSHEVLEPAVPKPNVGRSDAVRIVHTRRGKPNHARTILILRRCLEKDPEDARARFYLALAHFEREAWAEAEAEFLAYLRVLGRESDDERVMALLRLSWLALQRGDVVKCQWHAAGAHNLRPAWDACSFAVARAHMARTADLSGQEQRRAWEQVVFWVRAGLAARPAETGLWVNPLERAGYAPAMLMTALGHLGDLEGAIAAGREARLVLPRDPEVRDSLLRYEAAIAATNLRLAQGVLQEGARRAERLFGEGKIARNVLDAVRGEAGLDGTRVPSAGGRRSLDVVFVCGNAWDPWNPAIMERHGIGGSEQAVVHMAKGLAARGHRVRVYCNCGPEARVYDGVAYHPTGEIQGAEPADVLVAWRDASALELLRATARLVWVHDTDVANGNAWRWHIADRVMVLSEWHRECIRQRRPEIPEEKLYVTRNGVDLALFEQVVERDPERAVYSSSPTRGLGLLLDMWPDIRGAAIDRGAKDPSLHVYYGFSVWRKIATSLGDEKQLAMIDDLLERMGAIDMLKPPSTRRVVGVTFHDRVSPTTLAREMLGSGAWIYPSINEVEGGQWFETSCISAMEAQAAGLHVVTLASGALVETVRVGWVMNEDPTEGVGRAAFVEVAIAALSGGVPTSRQEIQKVAREHFSWTGVVLDWERLMIELVDENERWRGIWQA